MKLDDDHSESAEDFLNKLNPRGLNWITRGTNWIFRGQGDSTWGLNPKANRSEEWEAFKNPPFAVAPPDEWRRSQREGHLLLDFAQELDRLGWPLPGDSYKAIDYLRAMLGAESFNPGWIYQCKDLAALAQHHGLPTRLLDFTEDARVAAYFAAQPICKPAEDMCVWVLDHDVLARLSGEGRSDGMQVWLLRAPRASNPNLHAQAGLFVAWNGSDAIRSLEQVLDEDDGVIRRFFLPRRKAADLLYLLERERVSGATMFPNPDGVVRHMKERARRNLDGSR